jgi:hypothetical protein
MRNVETKVLNKMVDLGMLGEIEGLGIIRYWGAILPRLRVYRQADCEGSVENWPRKVINPFVDVPKWDERSCVIKGGNEPGEDVVQEFVRKR